MRRYLLILLLVTSYELLVTIEASADSIYMKDGSELKGVIVEDYKDRLILSTENGEIAVLKKDAKEIYYDSEEDNLVRIAELAKDKKDYEVSFAYYDKAYKVNPESKRAKDGMIFLHGYLFKKDLVDKEESVKRYEEMERQAELVEYEGEPESFKDAMARLKKSMGITLKMKRSQPEVSYVEMKSPAYEAGVRQGDLLVAIWGRLTGYMPIKEVVNILSDKPSFEIKCTIERTADVSISDDIGLLSGPEALIGAAFSTEFDGLTISDVKEGGQSFDAGLNKNDLIVAIDGNPTRYMPLKDAIELIKDSKEKTVKLTLRRELIIWKREGT